MCETHNRRDEYCEQCLLDSKLEHFAAMEQYGNRLEKLWENLPQLHEILLKVEREFPISGIRVLSEIPFPPDLFTYLERGQEGPARGELREVLEQLLTQFISLRLKNPDVKIGCSGKGFFLYDTSARLSSIG